jgi:hypothetical protein
LLMVATVVSDELQTTVVVRFCVDPSVYDPVAVNCCFVPFAILGLAGVIEMEPSVAGVTVSVEDPDTPPDTAVIVQEPAAVAVASPELLIVETPVLDELQVAEAVRSWVELSENVPVAVNC